MDQNIFYSKNGKCTISRYQYLIFLKVNISNRFQKKKLFPVVVLRGSLSQRLNRSFSLTCSLSRVTFLGVFICNISVQPSHLPVVILYCFLARERKFQLAIVMAIRMCCKEICLLYPTWNAWSLHLIEITSIEKQRAKMELVI